MSPAPRMTLDEYLRTPETVLPQELVYGVLRVADAPTPRHQTVAADFYVALRAHVRERRLGRLWLAPVDVILDRPGALVVQPDLIFVSNARLRVVTDRVWGPPDLVLEVLSPNPRVGKLDERLGWFAQYGARECWLVRQQEREVEVVSFARGQIERRVTFGAQAPIRSNVLPDFAESFESIVEDSEI